MSILSISRRTDIPTYFSDWFLNRLDAGEVFVRNNPYSPTAVTHYTFRKEDIDCIVFWTKNPEPMMNKLHRLDGFNYYFQYTITGYGKYLEGSVPDLKKSIDTFRNLSNLLPKNSPNYRVVWRYDPIVFTKELTMEWHLKNFAAIAKALAGFTNRCIISFVDMYGFVTENMNSQNIFVYQKQPREQLLDFCRQLAEIARSHGMEIYTCAELDSFDETGIRHGSCIDKKLIEEFIGCSLKVSKDKGQRKACGCVDSEDFGKYNTCLNGCKYCYATKNFAAVPNIYSSYDANAPFLCDTLKESDIVAEKRLSSLKIIEQGEQISFF